MVKKEQVDNTYAIGLSEKILVYIKIVYWPLFKMEN